MILKVERSLYGKKMDVKGHNISMCIVWKKQGAGHSDKTPNLTVVHSKIVSITIYIYIPI